MHLMTQEAVTGMQSADLLRLVTRAAPADIALGLTRIKALLARLGHPELCIPPVIHVAGTNGKGSVIAYLRAITEAGGLKVHSFTSPPLRAHADQITCAGMPLDEPRFSALLSRIEAANGGAPLTQFEAETAAALLAFADNAADIALIETGLGGRDDATNVVARPALTILTPIALDHCEYLGSTIAEIAAHKAGIMKPHVPAVVGPQSEAASDVIAARAQEMGATLYRHGAEWLVHEQHGRLVFQDEQALLDLPVPALPGRHQIDNAGTAIAALRALAGLGLSEDDFARGLRQACWPARLQRLKRGPIVSSLPEGSEIWLDGGHNPGAGVVIAEAIANLEEKRERPLFLIAGMLNTKDPLGYFQAFAGMARHVFTVPISSSDAGIEPALLAARAEEAGLSAEPISSVSEALRLLAKTWMPMETAPRILIGGSLYLAGEVLRDNGSEPK